MPHRNWPTALARVVAMMAALMLLAAPAAAQDRASHNDTARFLAGMTPSDASPLAALTESDSWRAHARSFDDAWSSLEGRQISRIRDWAAARLGDPAETMLYMFSGPDFLYADAFFPNASRYVFVGLEPVGVEPDLAAMERWRWAQGLSHLQASLNTILRFSFFRTRDMRTQLRQGGFPGVIPILYVFMARAGKTIDEIEFVSLGRDGAIAAAGAGATSGVKITFSSPGATRPQTLYYFQTDLSNGPVESTGFLAYIASLGEADSLLKSASYLPHYPGFSQIRGAILEQSRRIIQDDSGIPLRSFDEATWRVTPYGWYAGPIELFSERYQDDMRALFVGAEPIDFGIGYRWRPNQSNLILAERR